MAAGFGAYSVPSSHIVFLKTYLDTVHCYIDGQMPSISPLPSDWPNVPLKKISSWGINHRNIDLYHWILNGSPALVDGSGSIFQTWYEPDRGSAIKLDAHNERFAFEASQISELAALTEKVNLSSVREAFSAWCESQGKNYMPDERACQPFVDEFQVFNAGLKEAMSKGHGIVW